MNQSTSAYDKINAKKGGLARAAQCGSNIFAMTDQLAIEQLFMQQGLKGVLSEYIKAPTANMLEYITRKVRSSMDLYIVWSLETNMPFIDLSKTSSGWFVYVFSSEDMASGFVLNKQKEGHKLEIQEIVGGKKRMDFFAYLSDSGANKMLLDLMLYQPMSDYITVRKFDGYSESEPLRNAALNALMLYYMEQGAVQKITNQLENMFMEQMKKSYFYLPTMLDITLIRGDDDSTPCDFPIFRKSDEDVTYMAAFTDSHQFLDNFEADKFVAVPFTLQEMQKVLADHRLEAFILNPGTVNFELNARILRRIVNGI